MKYLRRDEQALTFSMNDGEWHLLDYLLTSYPMATDVWPQNESSPAKGPVGPDPMLLSAALAETKRAHQNKIALFLEKQPTPKNSKHFEFVLPLEEVEWFLQVVNEVRVGAWYALGCPEEDPGTLATQPDIDYGNLLRMEFAMLLQCIVMDELGAD